MAEIDSFVAALAEKMLDFGPRLLFATEFAATLIAALDEANAREAKIKLDKETNHGTTHVRGYER